MTTNRTTKTWTVTMKTGANKWTTTAVESADFTTAIATARRLVGGQFVKVI